MIPLPIESKTSLGMTCMTFLKDEVEVKFVPVL